MATNEGEPLHTITIHDNETGCQRIHYIDNRVAAHAFARIIHTRYNGSRIDVTDGEGQTITIRENGWSRA